MLGLGIDEQEMNEETTTGECISAEDESGIVTRMKKVQ